MKNEITHNINAYLWHTGLSRTLFYLPVFIVFYEYLGISYSKIMFLFTVFSLVKVVFEIPTGALADTIGRKNNLLLSMILKIVSIGMLVGISIRGNATDLWGYILLILSTVLFSLGEVLESGASSAFIYDYLKLKGLEEEYKSVAAKSSSISFFAMGVSGIIGGILYCIHISLPFIVTFLALFFSLIYLLKLDEGTHFNSRYKHLSLGQKHIKNSIKLIHNNKQIRTIILYGSFLFTFFMLSNWQLQIYFKHIGIDVYYFGIIFFVYNLVSSLGSKTAPKIEKRIGLKTSLYLIPIVLGITFILIGIIKSIFISLFLSSCIFIVWGYTIPIYSHFLNKYIPSETRATIISVQSLIRSIIYGMLSPLLGFLVDNYSIYLTLYLTGFTIIIFITPLLKNAVRSIKITTNATYLK